MICRLVVWIGKQALMKRARQHVKVTVYDDAYHAFNTSAAKIEVTDPFSHLGAGGQVIMKSNPAAREKSDAATVSFFNNHLTKK